MWLPYVPRYAMSAAGLEDYDMQQEEHGDFVRWDALPDFADAIRRAALEEAAQVCENVAEFYMPTRMYKASAKECALQCRALAAKEPVL